MNSVVTFTQNKERHYIKYKFNDTQEGPQSFNAMYLAMISN